MMVVQTSITGSYDKDVEHFFNSVNELLMRCTMFISIDLRKRAYLSIIGLIDSAFLLTCYVGTSLHSKIAQNDLIFCLFESFIIFQDKLVSYLFPTK